MNGIYIYPEQLRSTQAYPHYDKISSNVYSGRSISPNSILNVGVPESGSNPNFPLIVSVRDRLYQAGRFLYTITKIFGFYFTGYDKGIYNFCHILDLFSKYNYLIRIIQIE
ncbi:hypothetical protein CE91St1_27410 [Parabacteroides goldsteinii]|nr:hypothetical protein CE91St1_27410 [Parabacteroides goldsteinii]GKG79533.1 hypothetical protein CE91St2_27250 [Parabacteroides goldsteinii]